NMLWLRIHTDSDVIGLGETFIGPEAVEAYLHETAAPLLLGTDPLAIKPAYRRLNDIYVGFDGSGVEQRGNSAVDIALWDILGKTTGQPIVTLLGGASRQAIPTYNTCAGPDYVRQKYARTSPQSWSRGEGKHQDLEAFLTRPAALAEDLLADGISGMKIWPFDEAAIESSGTYISPGALKRGVGAFEAIRKAVGDRMNIMAEMHALWLPKVALEIANALHDYGVFWFEDPIKMRSIPVLKTFTEKCAIAVCASETLSGPEIFAEMIKHEAVDIVMMDLGFVGGLTAGHQICAVAETAQLPATLHDCTGPVVYTASVHLSLHAPNAIFQESVRAFYDGWYREVVDVLPAIANGLVRPPEGVGLGLALREDVFARPDVSVRMTENTP
ncbi:MAG: mandelate racemase/muconate lactonizing enzyme family protein, partial [Hyphomicrobiales bacterium]|nr:mandelate racemase/muconate lactonizing enzyme family protein [Hyphomicrobiales bacterium]